MTATFRKSFLRDLKKVSSAQVKRRIGDAVDAIEASTVLGDVPNLRKMSGAQGYYRMRIGAYRIGLAVDGDTVEFVRVLHRRDIYRYFP